MQDQGSRRNLGEFEVRVIALPAPGPQLGEALRRELEDGAAGAEIAAIGDAATLRDALATLPDGSLDELVESLDDHLARAAAARSRSWTAVVDAITALLREWNHRLDRVAR